MSSPAPDWLDAVVREFGRSAGLADFALNDRGAAAVAFETGAQLRFEYAFESLVVALQVPTPPEPAALRRFLSFAQPERRPGFKLRVAYLANQECVMLAARLAEREVTLPVLNTIFGELWQLSKA